VLARSGYGAFAGVVRPPACRSARTQPAQVSARRSCSRFSRRPMLLRSTALRWPECSSSGLSSWSPILRFRKALTPDRSRGFPQMPAIARRWFGIVSLVAISATTFFVDGLQYRWFLSAVSRLMSIVYAHARDAMLTSLPLRALRRPGWRAAEREDAKAEASVPVGARLPAPSFPSTTCAGGFRHSSERAVSLSSTNPRARRFRRRARGGDRPSAHATCSVAAVQTLARSRRDDRAARRASALSTRAAPTRSFGLRATSVYPGDQPRCRPDLESRPEIHRQRSRSRANVATWLALERVGPDRLVACACGDDGGDWHAADLEPLLTERTSSWLTMASNAPHLVDSLMWRGARTKWAPRPF